MKQLKEHVLQLFGELKKEKLDLHALFEAGGNNPEERKGVLDAIEGLLREGLLEAQGSDFYVLTKRGKQTLGSP